MDFVLQRPIEREGEARLGYVEVKSVTLSEPHADLPGVTIGLFPDTVSVQLKCESRLCVAVTVTCIRA